MGMSDFRYVPLHEIRRALSAAKHDPYAHTSVLAALARINALYMIAKAGSGHLGTTLSSVDIVAWLYLNELRVGDDPNSPVDVYFSSKGHDVPAFYALMIALERLPFSLIHQLRRLGGLPGHPDVGTPTVTMNTGSLGMGISKAKGVVLANRQLRSDGRAYVLTGDGELQEGQIWESLQQAANMGLHEVTAIIDHNKIQSDTWVAEVSDLGDLEKKFSAFGWHVQRCDGHDHSQISSALDKARRVTERPSVIIADTLKGKGVSFMEGSAMPPDDQMYHFHSGAPDVEQYSAAHSELLEEANRQIRELGEEPLVLETVAREPSRPRSGTERFIPVYAKALVEQGERRKDLIALDADLVLDCGLIPFRDRFPERFVECGIAEQDMVSIASGISSRGLLAIVHSFSCFLSARPNEQIYNNATERRKVIYVGSLAGLLPGGPGHSHQCVRDISSLGAIPHLVMLEPSCEAEVAMAVEFCVNGTEESCFLRLVSILVQVPYALPEGYEMVEGRGAILRDGADGVVFGYGPIMLTQAMRAADQLDREQGISLKVVNLPWLNRVDDEWLKKTVSGCRAVFTLDNHYVAGGQGTMLLARLAELGITPPTIAHRFGLKHVPESGGNVEVLSAHGLDSKSLASAIQEQLCAVDL